METVYIIAIIIVISDLLPCVVHYYLCQFSYVTLSITLHNFTACACILSAYFMIMLMRSTTGIGYCLM